MSEREPQRILGFSRRAPTRPRPAAGRPERSRDHEAGEQRPLPQHFLGLPVARHRAAGPEPQRVMGVPITWFEGIDHAFFAALAHPLRSLRARRAARHATTVPLTDPRDGR